MTDSPNISLSPSPIQEHPVAMYDLMQSSYLRSKQLSLFKEAHKEISDTGSISENTYLISKWYNRIFESILPLPNLNFKTKSLIATESPSSAFKYLTMNYEEAGSEVLELPLLSHPQYVYKLLHWSKTEKITLRYPLKFYETLLFSDIYWATKYYNTYKPDYFIERMIKYLSPRLSSNPTAPLFLYMMDQIPSLDDYIDIMGQHYFVAFQASSMFPDKIPLEDLLFEASLEPQWAYHILKYLEDKVPEEIKSMSYSAIQYSPPWLIEYLSYKDMFNTNPSKAKSEIKDSLEISGHILSEDIKAGILDQL